jgi:DNA-binding GntR family transcriptional regulator
MSAKALRLIQPVSKRDQVVASFKEAILSGIIQPGESIVESKLAQQLGAGIPLIREALIELEHQGYVQKVPYKGTTVTKLERGDVEQKRIVVPLFAFFVMKNRRERKSYLASAAKHEQIVEALPRLSAAKLRGLMRDSLSCWRTEILDELLPGEST